MPTGSIPPVSTEISMRRLSVAMGLFANTSSVTNCSLNALLGINRSVLGTLTIEKYFTGSTTTAFSTNLGPFIRMTGLSANSLIVVSTIVAGYEPDYERSTSVASTPSLTWNRGPRTVISQSVAYPGVGHLPLEYWWATQSAGGTLSVTTSVTPRMSTAGANATWMSNVAYSIIGYNTTNPTGAFYTMPTTSNKLLTATASLTTTFNGSLILGLVGDDYPFTGTPPPRTGSATYTGSLNVEQVWRDDTHMTDTANQNYMGYYFQDRTNFAGSYREGVTVPINQDSTILLMEIPNNLTGLGTGSQTRLSADFGGYTSSFAY